MEKVPLPKNTMTSIDYDKTPESSAKSETLSPKEGDYVLFLESNGTVDGKPSIHTTSIIVSQVRQVHADGNQVFLKEPDKNINHFVDPGSSLGYVENSSLVPYEKTDNAKFVLASEKIEKEKPVKVRIGEKEGKAFVVNGVCKGYSEQLQTYYVNVKNVEGLEAMTKIDKSNISLT